MIGFFAKYELYKITIGEQIFHFTSGAKMITLDDAVYIPKTINRENIQASQEMEKNSLKITMPIFDDFSQMMIGSFLEETVLVEIFERKTGLTRFLWRGRLQNMSPNDSELEFDFDSDYTELMAMG